MPTRDMTEQKPISRVWDIVKKARVGMLTTLSGGGLRARPLHARPDRDAGIIWFITDVRGAKDDEIGAAHAVGLVFVDELDRVYLSVTGRASVMRDTAKTKEVWTEIDDIWLPGGPDDPNVRLLCMQPVTAELWDGPSSAAAVAFEFTTKRLAN